jgi:hypothetical protein
MLSRDMTNIRPVNTSQKDWGCLGDKLVCIDYCTDAY